MKNYNVEDAFEHTVNCNNELDTNRKDRIMEFLLYYKENKKFNMVELTYYCVDRSCFKDVIDMFSLPTNLCEYRTILSKSKLALRMMMKSDEHILTYVKQFKSMVDDDLERDVFSYLVEKEDTNLDGTLEKIHQYLCKKYQNLSEKHIEEAMKNLLLKGFISICI